MTFLLYSRSKQFEVQQLALHQQLLVLLIELAAMKQLHNSLLEQESQQNDFIQQLSDLQKTLKSEDSGRGSKKTVVYENWKLLVSVNLDEDQLLV